MSHKTAEMYRVLKGLLHLVAAAWSSDTGVVMAVEACESLKTRRWMGEPDSSLHKLKEESERHFLNKGPGAEDHRLMMRRQTIDSPKQ